jgi:hypothetical protein
MIPGTPGHPLILSMTQYIIAGTIMCDRIALLVFPMSWTNRYSSRRISSLILLITDTNRVPILHIHRAIWIERPPRVTFCPLLTTHTPKILVQRRSTVTLSTVVLPPLWTDQLTVRLIRVSFDLASVLAGHHLWRFKRVRRHPPF